MFKLRLVNKPKLYKLKCNFSFPNIVIADMQEKTVIPTIEKQIILPDENYVGLSKVTVEAIQDDNLIAENIKDGVDILGVTGNYIGGKYVPRYLSFYYYTGTELDSEIENLDTSNMTSMKYLFYYCNKLTTLDLSNFDTSNVVSMENMFNNCKNLTSLDISSFETSNVTKMNNMFTECNALTNLDVSNFDTSKVIATSQMFYYCTSLKDLNLGDFDASKNAYIQNMFSYCTSLENITGCLKNLGQAYSTSSSANNTYYRLILYTSTLLTEQSIINMLNGLYDIKTKGCKTQSVLLGSDNLAKLTSEAGQQALSNAQAKGWNIS